MISIYTHTNNPFKKEFWKYTIRKLIKKYSGPDAVLDSLTRGLTELHIPFEINPKKPKYSIVHVVSGISILQEMIYKKQKKEITTLLAGPTLVRTPHDHDNIIQNENIDILLFPSQWTKDFYVNLVPALDKKIKIWPAGVTIPKESSSHQKILIFKKNIPIETYNQVIETLKNKGLSYDIITYGGYSKQEYHLKLQSASVLIYLQTTESQGLALQEAWSYNVPTLVWNNTNWRDGKYYWVDSKISAPYLTHQTGLFFTKDTFEEKLDTILTHKENFNPKEYCTEHLSNRASAKIYLEILKTYVK